MYKFILSAGLAFLGLASAAYPARAGIMNNLYVTNPNPYPVEITLIFDGETPPRPPETFTVPAGGRVTYRVGSQRNTKTWINVNVARTTDNFHRWYDATRRDYANFEILVPRH